MADTEACWVSKGCLAYNQCLVECSPMDQACYESCARQFPPRAVDLYLQAASCIVDVCPSCGQ